MTVEKFIAERRYLRNVSPRTVTWYERAFKSFDGAIGSRDEIIQRIQKLRERGVRPVSINSWLRCLNVYFRLLHVEHGQPPLKIPKLREPDPEPKGLAGSDIEKLIAFKPKPGRNQQRMWQPW